jgi:hypothetical protein
MTGMVGQYRLLQELLPMPEKYTSRTVSTCNQALSGTLRPLAIIDMAIIVYF